MINNKLIYKRALRLAVPMMIQNGITNAVGLIDNIMVGKLGTEAMTAVSIVGQLMFVFSLAVFGGLSGPGIYGAQFYGKGNADGFRSTFRTKVWMCIFCLAAGFTVFILFGRDLINLYLHGESTDINTSMTAGYGMEYLHIMLTGLPFFCVTQIYASSLRETGESVKPMIAGLCSVTADVVLNYMLIYGNFGMPELGVKGAAAATVIARIIEASVIVIWSHARKDRHTFLVGIYKTLLIPRQLLGGMLRKTAPIFMNEFLWAGGLAALTQCYSTRGLDIVAGLNISNAVCNLLNVVFVALGNAVGILIGQTLGAQQFKKAKKDAFSLMWFTGFVCIGLTVILISISGIFPKLYVTTDTVREYGQYFIIITALFFPLQGFLNSLYFTLRSGGKTLITFLFDSCFSWTVAVPAALALCMLTDIPILCVYAIIQALDFIKVTVGYILIKKEIWISNIV